MNKQITKKKILALGLGAAMLFSSLGTRSFAANTWEDELFTPMKKIAVENTKKGRMCNIPTGDMRKKLKDKKYDAKAKQQILDTYMSCLKEVEDKKLDFSNGNEADLDKMADISVKYVQKMYSIINGLGKDNPTPTPTPQPQPEKPNKPEQPNKPTTPTKPDKPQKDNNKQDKKEDNKENKKEEQNTNKTNKNTVNKTQDNKKARVNSNEKLVKTGKNDEMKFYVFAGICLVGAIGCGFGLYKTFKKKNQENDTEDEE